MIISLSTIKSNPNNPRTISEQKLEELKKSLESFPQMMKLRPIIIDEKGIILGGNMRYQALLALGYESVDESWIIKVLLSNSYLRSRNHADISISSVWKENLKTTREQESHGSKNTSSSPDKPAMRRVGLL